MNAARAKELAFLHGADAAGIAAAAPLAEYARFREAVRDIPHGLAFLGKSDKRRDLRAWYHDAKSVLVCAYRRRPAAALPGGAGLKGFLESTGRRLRQPALLEEPGARAAHYALEPEDYHSYIPASLRAILAAVKAEKPGCDGVPFCDTSPIMEKELARLAGLGFRARNTLLISREFGSLFYLGGVAFDFELETDAPVTGGCGACDLCERACPTGALKGGRLDPALCLSFWTTHARQPMPPELAARRDGWAYGCDACQDCCPYNEGKGA